MASSSTRTAGTGTSSGRRYSESLVDRLKSELTSTLRHHGVKRAALFGSLARGEATPASDIDLLVEFEGRRSLLDLAGLKLELQDLLNRKVDVLTYNSLHPLLKERVLGEQVVIL